MSFLGLLAADYSCVQGTSCHLPVSRRSMLSYCDPCLTWTFLCREGMHRDVCGSCGGSSLSSASLTCLLFKHWYHLLRIFALSTLSTMFCDKVKVWIQTAFSYMSVVGNGRCFFFWVTCSVFNTYWMTSVKSIPGTNAWNQLFKQNVPLQCARWKKKNELKETTGCDLSAWDHCIVKRQETIFPWKTFWLK